MQQLKAQASESERPGLQAWQGLLLIVWAWAIYFFEPQFFHT